MIQIVVEGHGWPLGIALFSANHHEAGCVDRTMSSLKYLPHPVNLLGDTAYSSKPLTKRLYRNFKIRLTAPPKRHYVHFFHDRRRLRRGKRRWMVERSFAWMKSLRRLETRWEVKGINFLGFLELGCAMILIKHTL